MNVSTTDIPVLHSIAGKELFTCTVIPNRGAWLEYETDSNDVFYVRVDRKSTRLNSSHSGESRMPSSA